jgi:hypothetical protein
MAEGEDTPKFPSFEALWDAACHTKPGEELKFPIATYVTYQVYQLGNN